MTLLASAPAWLVATMLLLVFLSAVEDGLRLTIGNWQSAGIAIAAFVAVAIDGPATGLWQNVLLFVVMLAVGTFLFARGWMGGGDIKLLAASSLWFDLASGWKLLVAIALAGGLEAVLLIGLRRIAWPDPVRRRVLLLRRGEGIPYGIAIALGVALMAWWLRR